MTPGHGVVVVRRWCGHYNINNTVSRTNHWVTRTATNNPLRYVVNKIVAVLSYLLGLRLIFSIAAYTSFHLADKSCV